MEDCDDCDDCDDCNDRDDRDSKRILMRERIWVSDLQLEEDKGYGELCSYR